MAKNANFWTNGPFSIIYQQDLFKPLGLYENVKEWKFKRAKKWKCKRVKVWKSESVWKCKTVNSDLNTFSFLLNLYLWLNLILNSGAVLHLHLRWRYFQLNIWGLYIICPTCRNYQICWRDAHQWLSGCAPACQCQTQLDPASRGWSQKPQGSHSARDQHSVLGCDDGLLKKVI